MSVHSVFRTASIGVLTAWLAGCGGAVPMHQGVGAALPPAPDMNVLVVSFDAMRADAMGLYGYHRTTTPNLDRFADEALVFDNAWSAAPVTPTSFASAFTGRYPYRSFLGWQMLPGMTLAQLMRDSGRHSFGLFNNVQMASERNFGQGFDRFEVANWSDRELLETAQATLSEVSDRPFFGWIHFISPHTPYHYRPMSAHLAPPATEGRFAEAVPANYEVENDQELLRARELYDGEVFFADHLFGRLLAHLESLDLLERTVIVVTADHGEEFMDHGRVGHKSLYQEVVRIPMLIRHPGAPDGTRTDAPYLNIDLLPTLASMIGSRPPADLDGIDLRRPFELPRVRIVTGMTSKERYQIAIERGGLKLIQVCRPEYGEELYDLTADPAERTDLVLDRPDLAGELADVLLAHTRMDPCELIVNSTRGKAPEDLLSAEQIEQLRSLGYIQ